MGKIDFTTDPRFEGIQPFESKVWLSSPTMHKLDSHGRENYRKQGSRKDEN